MQQRTGRKLSGTETVACAGVAGGLAGMIGNPTEVIFHEMYVPRNAERMRLFWSVCARMVSRMQHKDIGIRMLSLE